MILDLVVLDTGLNRVGIVDSYKSLIWTDRYYECGDFEIYLSMDPKLLNFLKLNYYIASDQSEHLMIIEKIQIETDIEDGDFLIISGRSLESILDRRIVWGQKILNGNFQNGMKTILNESIISPSINGRKISNFIFKQSSDTKVTSEKIDIQFTGDNVYEVICKLCSERGLGFKITLNSSNKFVFEFYAGVDRSYDQDANSYVIFSPNYENIINSKYLESNSNLKTITLIGGEGEGSQRKYTTVGSGSGLNRRELFTDARDISSDVGEGVVLTDSEYTKQLQQRGSEKLNDHKLTNVFEGQTETSLMFKYGIDFFNGDIVQIENEYGNKSKARITEIIMSTNEEESTVYPTFKIVD